MLSAMDYASAEPNAIRAGDSVTWTRETPEHSVDAAWALKYRLLWPSGSPVEIPTTGVGTLHTVSLSSTDTSAFTAGPATLVAIVENSSSGSVETLESQPITILTNLATAANHDNRSANQKALADAKAALDAYAASGRVHVAEYDIAGRRMKFRSAAEIRDLIAYYQLEVNKETNNLAVLAGGSPTRIGTRA